MNSENRLFFVWATAWLLCIGCYLLAKYFGAWALEHLAFGQILFLGALGVFPGLCWRISRSDLFSKITARILKEPNPQTRLFFFWQFLKKKSNFFLKGKSNLFLFSGAALLGSFILYQLRLGIFRPPPEGMGDSLLLLQNLPVHAKLFGYMASFDELLSLYIHSRFYLFLNEFFGLSSYQALATESLLSFFPFLLIFFYFLGKQKPSRKANSPLASWSPWVLRLMALALLFFTPRLALFAGYIENYTIPGLYLLFLLWLMADLASKNDGAYDNTIRHKHKTQEFLLSIPFFKNTVRIHKKNVWQGTALAILFAWGMLHHLLVAFAFPALLYFFWIKSQSRFDGFLGTLSIAGLSSLLFLFAIIFIFMQMEHSPSLFGAHISHPPFLFHPGQLFSLSHLWDFFNLLLLCGPAFLFFFLLGFFLFTKKTYKVSKNIFSFPSLSFFFPDQTSKLLGIASVSYLVEAFFLHAEIGFPADWDLFSSFFVPVGLFFYYRLKYESEHGTGFFGILRFFAPAVFLANLIFSCLWLGYLSEQSPIDSQNLRFSQSIALQSIKEIKASKNWQLLSSKSKKGSKLLDEKKTIFVNLQIFLTGAQIYLQKAQETSLKERTFKECQNTAETQGCRKLRQIQRHLQLLKKEKENLGATFSLPHKQFKNSIEKLYQRLTPINLFVQEQIRQGLHSKAAQNG